MKDQLYGVEDIQMTRRDFGRLAAFSVTSVLGATNMKTAIQSTFDLQKLPCDVPDESTSSVLLDDCQKEKRKVFNKFTKTIFIGAASTLGAIMVGTYSYALRLDKQVKKIHPDLHYRHPDKNREHVVFEVTPVKEMSVYDSY